MNAKVEVAYAKPDLQLIVEVAAVSGMTVQEAIEQSKIQERFPEINLELNRVGVFGKVVALDSPLSAGDRVEIYRPLIADPKEARRQRAAGAADPAKQ